MFTNAARIAAVVAVAAGLGATGAGGQTPGWSVALEVADRRADDLYSVHFLTRHVGWAVGDSQEGYTGIHHTTDGGRTWRRLDLFDGQASPPSFSAVRFADANHGWIATRTGRLVLRTVDGGQTWIPVEMSDVDNVFANDMLTAGTSGLIIAADAGMIHRTLDGGRTWVHTEIATPVAMGGKERVEGLALAGASTLFAVTRSTAVAHGGIYRSDDGGATWRAVFEADQWLRAIAFHDAQNGVVVGRDAAYWTSDGGETWQRTISPGVRHSVRYLDASTVVAVGYDPAVLVSRDGGRTWRAPPAQPPRATELIELNVVDEGWWFATSDRPARLFLHYDPELESALVESMVTLPSAFSFGDVGPLPPGEYRIAAGHLGYDHGLALSLVTPAPGVEIGVQDELGENQFACSPCEGVVPLDVEYEKQEVAEATPAADGADSAAFGFRIEPTSDGLVIVLDARLPPPEGAIGALAALGIGEETEVDVSSAARSGGGMFGRLRRAASGDVRGAVSGLDPAAAAQRARAAEASPPAAYHVKLRYPLSLLPQSP